jgi:gas vesicle protein
MAENRQGSNFGSLFSGFILGALLMAPQSGEETRSFIRDKSMEVKDRATDTLDDTLARAEDALNEARMRAKEMADQVESKTSGWTKDVIHKTEKKVDKAADMGEQKIEQGRSELSNM